MFSIFKKKSPIDIKKEQESQEKRDIFDFLPEDVRAESEKYLKIIKDTFVDLTADKLAIKAIKRLLSLIWDLPASSGHHHSKPFGLYLHSLETAATNLRLFEERLFFKIDASGTIDSFETKKTKPIEQYSAFLSGLVSYLEEIFMWKVYAKENEENILSQDIAESEKIEIVKQLLDYINPYVNDFVIKTFSDRDRYAAFVSGLVHDIGKVVKYKAQYLKHVWNPLQEGLFEFTQKYPEKNIISQEVSYALHKKIAPILLHRVISYQDLAYIGAENISEILDMFIVTGSSTSKYKFVTTQSDMKSTKASVEKNITQDFSGAVVNELRKGLQDAKYPVNSITPGIWVQENYTAVAISLINDAIKTVQNTKEFEGRQIDFNSILRDWVERKWIKAENWKAIWQMEIQTMSRPFIQKVVQFKNDTLWQGVSIPGICKLPLSFTISAN